MTDKDTIDYCKNCSVEPPAMKFKCPECKHNPNKEQVICKYKFQDKEKFDGKPYCTCFCELCEDLPLCDDNCQIYEDYKRLTCKTSECEELKKQLKTSGKWRINAESLNEKLDIKNARYLKALEEIEKYCMDDCIGDERLRTFDKCQQCISGDILDIIDKAKGEG